MSKQAETRSFSRIANKPYLVGILNLSDNSFSDGGLYRTPEQIHSQATKMLHEGADIIDIGAEATGPNSKEIAAKEELALLLPALDALPSGCYFSIDTYKSTTAEACIKKGAQMINDVSGLQADPELASVIASTDASLVMMFNPRSGLPHASESVQHYDDVIDSIRAFFDKQISLATAAGIKSDKIILDPGMGAFLSSNPSYSWEVLRRLGELHSAFPEYRLYVGTSRKGFLGGPLEERDPLSQLSALFAFGQGAHFIRTHNVSMAESFFEAWGKLTTVC
jgi:dihydropteroate synthase